MKNLISCVVCNIGPGEYRRFELEGDRIKIKHYCYLCNKAAIEAAASTPTQRRLNGASIVRALLAYVYSEQKRSLRDLAGYVMDTERQEILLCRQQVLDALFKFNKYVWNRGLRENIATQISDTGKVFAWYENFHVEVTIVLGSFILSLTDYESNCSLALEVPVNPEDVESTILNLSGIDATVTQATGLLHTFAQYLKEGKLSFVAI